MLVHFEYPRTYDTLLDKFFTPETSQRSCECPSLDVMEGENEYKIFIELPGVKKEDLKLSLEDGVLTINGERKPYEIPDEAKILLNEMRTQEFKRSIRLPQDVDFGQISAELNNGLLQVTLKKTEEAKPKSIEIK